MPALNIIAIHETVLNSGSSSSSPSGMRPYLLAARQITKITKKVVLRTKNQPVLVMTQSCAFAEAELRLSVLAMPHATKPMARRLVTEKTTGSMRSRHDVVC